MKYTYQTKFKLLFAMILLSALAFTGCKKFLDINDNPNNPDNAEPSLLLPTVQASLGQVVGNSFQTFGNFWAQYWTQNPSATQYRSIDQYRVTNTDFDRPWLTIYRNALQNAQLIIDNQTPNNQHIQGIAYILKAYSFQLATDAFGDIPLTEALKGNEFSSPKYETQQVVYDSIFNYINKGIALVNTPNAISPGAQDLIFNGDMAQWRAFANTLKLRAYLRLSQVNAAKAQAGIAAMYNSGATFLTTDASIKYATVGGNENPMYNEMVGLGGTQNPAASATAVEAYKRNNDPRLFKFYDVLNGDTIAYIKQGSYSSNSNKLVSPPSPLVGARASNPASATAPVKLISASESYFLQAEAVARGWAVGGNLLQLYTAGVRQSFTSVGLTTAQADAYLLTAPDALLTGTLTGNLKAIITQKYYAMNGFQGFEAWTEWRRTGYPSFIVTSAASTLGAGRMPLRLLYPTNEVTTNQNYPGTIPIYTPVWWDK